MKAIFLLMLIIIGVSIFCLTNEDKIWVFVNGNDAEIYAIQLLNKKSPKIPNKFIDYSISSNNGYVIFFQHRNSSVIYGYFPTKAPADIEEAALNADWKPLNEKWFVSRP